MCQAHESPAASHATGMKQTFERHLLEHRFSGVESIMPTKYWLCSHHTVMSLGERCQKLMVMVLIEKHNRWSHASVAMFSLPTTLHRSEHSGSGVMCLDSNALLRIVHHEDFILPGAQRPGRPRWP